MRCVDYSPGGSAESLTLIDTVVPSLSSPNDLLINIHAAGVCRPDVLQRQGLYPAPDGASRILGLEVAGCVAAVGRDVTDYQVGDRVCALTNGGGYADYACVPKGQCLPIPETLSFIEAAAIPEALFTVFANLIDLAELQSGSRVLIHGGSSGVGTIAIQVAKEMGCQVFVTAGTPEKCSTCLALGADRAICYEHEDFVEVCKRETGGEGIDVILDMVGGEYIQRNINIAAVEGRIVNIAFQSGSRADVNFMRIMLKRLKVMGSTLRSRSSDYKRKLRDQIYHKVWSLVAEKRICPLIDTVFPLSDVCRAHQLMESGCFSGKIVLDLGG